MNNNYSGRPTALIHIFEHFVFFSAFDKAKNAHRWRGALLGFTIKIQGRLKNEF